MIALPDVDELMAGGLQARLDSLSAERAKAKEKVYWTGGGGVVVAILVAIILMILGAEQFAYFGAAIVAGGAIAWANSIRQKMVNALKQEMNGALATSLQVDYSVAAFSGQEFERACEYALLPDYDDSYLPASHTTSHSNHSADSTAFDAKAVLPAVLAVIRRLLNPVSPVPDADAAPTPDPKEAIR